LRMAISVLFVVVGTGFPCRCLRSRKATAHRIA
jgi:hypothetical protein